jgi:molybdate transport system substrate-binding protein
MQRFFSWFVLLALVSACSGETPGSNPRVLYVYAAASLTDAFTEIGEAFETQHPGVVLSFNFGGSQNLRTQIEQGAPADVFAAANTRELDLLEAGKLVEANSAKIFLANQLIVILPAGNPAGIVSLEDLGNPGLKLILAAEEVPAGRYARQILEALDQIYGGGYRDRVLGNVVSNEDNIRQAVTKIQLGEGDASIVYLSDAVAVPGLQTIEIPNDMNVVAHYPIAPLIESKNRDLANEFIDFVLSPEGQATLKKWGFTPFAP